MQSFLLSLLNAHVLSLAALAGVIAMPVYQLFKKGWELVMGDIPTALHPIFVMVVVSILTALTQKFGWLTLPVGDPGTWTPQDMTALLGTLLAMLEHWAIGKVTTASPPPSTP